MKRHQTSFFILSLLAIVLTACTEEIKNELELGHEIAFKIMSSQPAATRSAAEDKVPEPQPFVCQGDTFYLQTEITPMDTTMGRQATTRGAEKNASNLQTDGFMVSAYNTSDGTTRGTSYFEYLTATYADSKFTPQGAGTAKYWPAGKLMFYAYYPAATASNGITQGANASTLTYTVPSTPANQPDLMTARATDQQYTSGDGTAALTFNHALCAIKFQTGTDIAGGTINSITFNNIYTSGTYNLDTQTWDFTGKSRGNVSFSGLNIPTTEGTAGTTVLSGNNTLMMIPQTFNASSSIVINFLDKYGESHNLSFSLNSNSWVRGKYITYTINSTGISYKFLLNPLWYVAKYNMNFDGSFNKSESTSQGGLFQWTTAMANFAIQTTSYDGWAAKNYIVEGIKYHMPTWKEMCSIVPQFSTSVRMSDNTMPSNNIFSNISLAVVGTNGTQIVTELPCTFGYNNSTKYSNGTNNTSNAGITYKSYWSPYTNKSFLRYAIRFLGTNYCSAWRYRILNFGTTSARLEITSKIINSIGISESTKLVSTMATLVNGTFDWSGSETAGVITRTFYMCGHGGGNINAPGTAAKYRGNCLVTTLGDYGSGVTNGNHTLFFFGWSTEWSNNDSGREEGGLAIEYRNYTDGYNVRLFRDN